MPSKYRVGLCTLRFFAAVMMISLSLGIPSVTLAPPWPARWNVLSVICVDGSPTDWAAIEPTVSPGAAKHRMYLTHINSSNASLREPGDDSGVSAVSSPEDLPGKRFAVAVLAVLRVLSCRDGGLVSRKACRDFWKASLTHLSKLF